jgi:hypothetical protein
MTRNPILKVPVLTVLMVPVVALSLIIFTLVIVGLFSGALKEIFFYISSSQGFSTKTTAFNTNPVNVLITQE